MDETSRPPGGPTDGSAAGPAADDRPDAREDVDEPPVQDRAEAAGVDAPPAGTASETDYKDRWLRAEAELQNFRRRASREWEEGRRAAEEGVLLEMVAVLDDLERALAAAESSGAEAAWTQGVALVAQRIRDVFARQGVTVEDPLGRPFDPAFHEALLELDATEGTSPGMVVQVVHKGYRRGARALRAARVVVARAPAGSAP